MLDIRAEKCLGQFELHIHRDNSSYNPTSHPLRRCHKLYRRQLIVILSEGSLAAVIIA